MIGSRILAGDERAIDDHMGLEVDGVGDHL